MRTKTALLVCVVVVLAGCNAFGPGAGTTTDPGTDPASETTGGVDAGATDDPADDGTVPPGLSPSGVTDADALAAAHTDALANRSYTFRRHVTVVAENGTTLGTWGQFAQVGADRDEFNATQSGDGVNAYGYAVDDTATYTNGSMTLTRGDVFRDGYRREAGHGFAESAFTDGRFLADLFDASVTSVRTVERDGETWFRVRTANGSETFSAILPNETVVVEVTNVTATALVAPSGLVKEVTYEYDFVRGDVSGHRKSTRRYTAVGETTVERPPWFDEAMNVTAGRR